MTIVVILDNHAGNYQTSMQLLEPEGSDQEECPICMETFAKASLDFCPEGTSFVQDRPSLCVAKLECGHSFNPLAICFHMYVSGMQCPICRSGDSSSLLKLSCIPQHLRILFQVHSHSVYMQVAELRNSDVFFVTAEKSP
jgi:hypothetical protein